MTVGVEQIPRRLAIRNANLTRLFAILGVLSAVAITYWPSVAALHELWSDTQSRTYTHGYPIAATSLWLLFRTRGELSAAVARPALWAAPLLLLASAAWLIAWRAGIRDAHLLFALVTAAIAIVALFGWRVARIVVFPLGFLVFALPIWGSLNQLLQSLTIRATDALVWFTGLPAYVEGDIVIVPSGSFEISGGCSGLHFFIVGLAIAALYGEVLNLTRRRRLVALFAMASLAILCNWLRVFTIVVAGYATDMQHFLVTVDHYWFGWILFAVVMALFMWMVSGWPASRADTTKSDPAQPHGVRILPALLTAICLVSLPALAYASAYRAVTPDSPPMLMCPPGNAGARLVNELAPTMWKPHFVGATTTSSCAYSTADGGRIDLYTVAYREQRQGAELVSYANSIVGYYGAPTIVRTADTVVGSAEWREMEVIARDQSAALMRTQMRIGDRTFLEPLLSQLWYGIVSLRHPTVSSLVALRTACVPDCEAARTRLNSLEFAPTPGVSR